MVGLPDLMAAAQRAGVDPRQAAQVLGGGGGGGMPPQGGMPPGGAPPQGGMPSQGGGSGGSDMAQQLLQIAGTLAQSPKGAALMQTAIQSLMGGGGGDGMLNKMATAQAGDPRAMAIPGGGMPANAGTDIEGRGPTTDMDLMNVSQANQGVRGNLPPQFSKGDYTGYASEMEPMPDPRQTPMPSDEQMLEKARLGMGAAPGLDPQIVKEMVKAGMDPSDPKQIQQFIKQNGDGDGNDSEGTTEDQYEGDNGGPRSGTGNNPRNGGSYSLVPGGRK